MQSTSGGYARRRASACDATDLDATGFGVLGFGAQRVPPARRSVARLRHRDSPGARDAVAARPANEARHLSEIFFELDHFDTRATPRWLDRLRTTFSRYPGARIEVKELENGPPIDAPIAIRLIGKDLDRLRVEAARVEALLAATPGTRDVDNPVRVQRTDLTVAVDTQKAGLFGIPPGEIDVVPAGDTGDLQDPAARGEAGPSRRPVGRGNGVGGGRRSRPLNRPTQHDIARLAGVAEGRDRDEPSLSALGELGFRDLHRSLRFK